MFAVFVLVCKSVVMVIASLAFADVAAGQNLAVDLSAYSTKCGVEVRRDENGLTVAWPMGDTEFGHGARSRSGYLLYGGYARRASWSPA
ncbi:MAG: hypothetical protein DME26_05285 [Verrucomicrobia bacterium]|nr:MAG: hypothetical protein DME26_05285 [Verrucomicrobiota bacterium]